VIDPISRLNAGIARWVSSQGTSATPANFANDETDSFAEVIRTLQRYEAQLLEARSNTSDAPERKPRVRWLEDNQGLVAAIGIVVGIVAAVLIAVLI
jgi:hypothetical protein